MKLIVQVQLQTSPAQKALLERTLRRANAACDWLSGVAFETGTFGQYALQKLAYHDCRREFPELSSQVVIRALSKVADAYRLDQERRRKFRALGAFAYDSRILSWSGDTVSIWTVEGRQRIPFVCGERQRQLLANERGESDLVLTGGRFYLFVTVDVPDAEEREVLGWLGVDLGIVNIAATSDGTRFASADLNGYRARAMRLRRKLQRKGTKAANRLLAKRRRKERRFAHHVNHCVSKQIVAAAERTARGIALEDLEGIRERVRASRALRRRLARWAYADLQLKIDYKARRVGIPVCYVDPRNTSRECRACGHAERANRRTRDIFACRACGHVADADVHAACVIAGRAAVIRPYAGNVEVVVSHGVDLQGSAPERGRLRSLARGAS